MAFTGNIFFIGDLHLDHKRITQLGPSDKFRRPFADPPEMVEHMRDNWNRKVTPRDKVYVVGDVALNPKFVHRIEGFNGKLHLIKGNHDLAPLEVYQKYFYEVSACRVFPKFIATHIPIHPGQLDRWHANVHGHLHEKVLKDKRYVNVSAEQTDYEPLSLEEVEARIKKPWRERLRDWAGQYSLNYF